MLEFAEDFDLLYRNPDACTEFGGCEFFSLCSGSQDPPAVGVIPDGFRKRKPSPLSGRDKPPTI